MSTIHTRPGEDVVSAAVTATGTVVASAAGRLRGLYIRTTGTEGTAVFRDGGASGTIILTLNTPAAEGHMNIDVPGGGIAFSTDLHATLTNVDGVTAFYTAQP